MDNIQGKVTSLQESLRNLNLQPDENDFIFKSQNILLGKILSSRNFCRFTITEIIGKTWKLKSRVHIEKINENFFKFLFGCKEDRDTIFQGRPWSLNGAHLILKDWPADKALEEITFETTSFFIQIHGLPPAYLHEKTANMMGNKIGKIHKETINRKCVVAQRYIRFRVDISVENPLPAGFFMDRQDSEIWIQFKLERLSDFCYRCGSLMHITGKCGFNDPVLVTTQNGISAKLYGPWLRAENSSTLLFINTPPLGENDRKIIERKQEADVEKLHRITARNQSATDESQHLGGSDLRRDSTKMEFGSALEMCHELASLQTTLKRQSLGSSEILQDLAVGKLKDSNLSLLSLANWAAETLKEIAVKKDFDRRGLEGLDPDLLSYVGLGSLTYCRIPEDKYPLIPQPGFSRKRAAFQNLEERPNRCFITQTSDPASCSANRAHFEFSTENSPPRFQTQNNLIIISRPEEVSNGLNDQTQDSVIGISPSELLSDTLQDSHLESQLEDLCLETPFPERNQGNGRSRNLQRQAWSWKKEARRSSQRRNQMDRLDAGESSRGPTSRRLDFP